MRRVDLAGGPDALAEPALDDFLRLTDVALRRRTEPAGGLYLAESTKVIDRALAAGHRPRSVLTRAEWLPVLEPLLAGHPEVPVYVGEDEALTALTGFHLHRGALASMHRPALLPPAVVLAGARRVVVLEDIVDHTNVGAIFRSVAALGADAVLVTPRCADPLYRRRVRASIGAVLQVPCPRPPAGRGRRRAGGSGGPACRSGGRRRRCCATPDSGSSRWLSRRAASTSTRSPRIRRSGWGWSWARRGTG